MRGLLCSLEVDYDYAGLSGTLTRELIGSRPEISGDTANCFRWKWIRCGAVHWLDAAGSNRPPGEKLGLAQLYLKNDSVSFPTLSFGTASPLPINKALDSLRQSVARRPAIWPTHHAQAAAGIPRTS
jgi:hypothetical protein